jgi:UDP-N-acetylmuramate dehydrogenase
MNIYENVSLAPYSTMGLGGTAAALTAIETRMELLEALSWAQERKLPVLMIGGGSNIIWRDEGYPGLIIINKLQRYETFQEDDTNFYITAGSGEIWDTVVERTAQAGLTGIEALSLIPGTTGATPVQNVGAYGQEISQTLTTIEAFDTQAADFVTVPAADCGFGYRTSRFKTTDRGRFYITWPSQPLVLVNEKAHSANDVIKFKQQIVDSVAAKFGINLLQEPEILP